MAKNERAIRITYEVVTPESAADGDVAESGFTSDNGIRYPVEKRNEAPTYEMAGPHAAATFIIERGGVEPSSSEFDERTWYRADDVAVNITTGSAESRSYHLIGFPEGEKRAIFDAVVSGMAPDETALEARRRLESEYVVGENGRVRSPGRFEGEFLYVPYLWEECGDEAVETLQYDTDAYYVDDAAREAFSELGSAEVVLIWTDDVGFVRSSAVSKERFAAIRDGDAIEEEPNGTGRTP